MQINPINCNYPNFKAGKILLKGSIPRSTVEAIAESCEIKKLARELKKINKDLLIKQDWIEERPQTVLRRVYSGYREETIYPGHYELTMRAVSESDERGRKIGYDTIQNFKVTNSLLLELGVIKEYNPYKIIEEFNKTV